MDISELCHIHYLPYIDHVFLCESKKLFPLLLQPYELFEYVEFRYCIVFGKIDVVHTLSRRVDIPVAQIIHRKHYIGLEYHVLQLICKEISRIRLKVLAGYIVHVRGLRLGIYLAFLIQEPVDVLSETLPYRMRFFRRKMQYRKFPVEEEVKSEHLCVEQIIYILSSCNKWIKRNRLEQVPVYHHCSSECKRSELYPWLLPYYLVKCLPL